MRLGRHLAKLAIIFAIALSVRAESSREHWVATWAIPQNFVKSASPGFLGGARAGRGPAPTPDFSNLENRTIRMVGRISLGGKKFRIRLTNGFGYAPVAVSSVQFAIQTSDAKIAPGSSRPVLFGGKPSIKLIPGMEAVSDIITADVSSLSHVAVSIFLEHLTDAPTTLGSSLHPVAYLAKATGDFTAAADLEEASPARAYYWLSGIEVLAPSDTFSIVAMGDSITDALGAQRMDDDWPTQLGSKLLPGNSKGRVSVVDVGISGNRLLDDGAGVAGLARFERHVLSQPGARWLVLLEGINDIGAAGILGRSIQSSEVTDAYRQIIEKAHAHGIRVAGCTLLPIKGAFYFRDTLIPVRNEVNQWIRTSGAFDAVFDFDKAMRDPQDPEQIRPDLERGDHLHPNAAGYRVMADAVDLKLLSK